MIDFNWIIAFYAALAGVCVGSFLKVVIYRMPMNMSVVSPGSHCPECGSPVRFYDNIPLLSWLLLMGICRDCGAGISSRYFWVEFLTGALSFGVVAKYGVTIESLILLLVVWGLVAITFIDLDFQIIPDEISIGGFLLALVLSPFMPVEFAGAIVGALVGGGIFYALAILYPGGMGGGDIKLIAAIGAFLGWKMALLTIVLGSFAGAVVGIAAMTLFGKTRKDKIPFGPFLALGALVSIFFGNEMITAYLFAFA